MTDQTPTAIVTRTAIVTGAARGIGAAIAKRLSSDGFAVAVLDLEETACKTVVDEIKTSGGKALAVGVDVADEQAVETAVARVVGELGAPTVLVNNAGITRDNLLFKMTADDWDAVMNVHLRGSFLMSRATQKYMTEAAWGRIVNLSSVSALGNRGQANYAAAKAGLQGFTKTLAIELGKFGITVNAVAPGFIATEMTQIYTVEGLAMGVNYGSNKVRFPAPVPVGSRVRAGAELLELTRDPRGAQATVRVTIEREGADKPACVAETVSVLVD